MPNYEFQCETCGSFERILALTEAAQSSDCPECGNPANRVYSMPNVISTSKATREARQRNERGAEPNVVRAASRAQSASREPARETGRPWQISH